MKNFWYLGCSVLMKYRPIFTLLERRFFLWACCFLCLKWPHLPSTWIIIIIITHTVEYLLWYLILPVNSGVFLMIPNIQMRKRRLEEVTESGSGGAEVARNTGTSEPMSLGAPLSLLCVFLRVPVQVSPPWGPPLPFLHHILLLGPSGLWMHSPSAARLSLSHKPELLNKIYSMLLVPKAKSEVLNP